MVCCTESSKYRGGARRAAQIGHVCHDFLVILAMPTTSAHGTSVAIHINGPYHTAITFEPMCSHIKPEGLTSSPLRGPTQWLVCNGPVSPLGRTPGLKSQSVEPTQKLLLDDAYRPPKQDKSPAQTRQQAPEHDTHQTSQLVTDTDKDRCGQQFSLAFCQYSFSYKKPI